jgi:TRAP-type mannitol/chloroaromatic compound transport system permease small subunit
VSQSSIDYGAEGKHFGRAVAEASDAGVTIAGFVPPARLRRGGLAHRSGEKPLSALLKFATGMDWISTQLGKVAAWAVLAAALISAGNAFVRYGLDISSNAWLEIQWYLFAAIVMLGAPVVLRLNEHVRVDILYGKLKGKGSVYVDLFGLLFFLLPVMALIAWLSWPLFFSMLRTGEMSNNAGGLIRWPAMMLLPLGFALMFLQGVSEVIKRIGFLLGKYQLDTHYEKPVQ